jgi:Cys-tRNA(Pro)/Cys-tRNA(Cys) deacylase
MVEDIHQVFKILALKRNTSGHFVSIIPIDDEVDLKKAVKVSGKKAAPFLRESTSAHCQVRSGAISLSQRSPLPSYSMRA